MSVNNIVSIVAAQAAPYIKEKRPSRLIPFHGDFPLLSAYRESEYHKIINSTPEVNKCPQWVQNILLKGQAIYKIEEGFKDYLFNNNIAIEDFMKKTTSDKSTDLMRYLNANSLGLESLNIV